MQERQYHWINKAPETQADVNSVLEAARPQVMRFAISRTGNPDLADDIAQETLLGAWRPLRHLDPERGTVRNLVLKIAERKIIDRGRAEAVIKRRFDPLENHVDTVIAPDHADDVVDTLDTRARREKIKPTVREAVEALPPDQMEAIVLTFFRGLSYSKAAETLNIPLGTFKSRIRLAFGKLRRSLSSV